MTACSQYYAGTYVPELAKNKDKVAQRILDFFEKTKNLISIQEYVVDYALDPKSDKIWIIEVNNPPPVAGQALFDWDNEKDRKTIMEGPFEFRILEKPPKDPMKGQVAWLQMMKEELNKKEKEKSLKKNNKRLSLWRLTTNKFVTNQPPRSRSEVLKQIRSGGVAQIVL